MRHDDGHQNRRTKAASHRRPGKNGARRGSTVFAKIRLSEQGMGNMAVRPVRKKFFQVAIKAAAVRLNDVKMMKGQAHR
jgi:hypothetical protein